MWEKAKEIMAEACEKFMVTPEQIRGRSRKKWIVKARKYICQEMHKYGYSSTEIGYFIHRHHTAVLHHLERLSRDRS